MRNHFAATDLVRSFSWHQRRQPGAFFSFTWHQREVAGSFFSFTWHQREAAGSFLPFTCHQREAAVVGLPVHWTTLPPGRRGCTMSRSPRVG
jgi:hypothetical protein